MAPAFDDDAEELSAGRSFRQVSESAIETTMEIPAIDATQFDRRSDAEEITEG